jgi:paraquat-inducible protein B
MGPEGMHLELESIQSLLSGGIAFETPRANENDPPADESVVFQLYADKAEADAAFFKQTIPYVAYFESSIQGLSKGSPVQLFGVQVGSVSDVKLVYDGDNRRMVARVAFDLQPERVVSKTEPNNAAVPQVLLHAFLETGMRVVLDSSSMLTGSKELTLTYDPKVKPAELPREGNAMVLPASGGGLDNLTASMSEIATKVNKVPFEDIGNNLNATILSFNHLASQVDANATPALQQLPGLLDQMQETVAKANGALGESGYGQNSEFQHGIERLVNQVNDAARSFRVLADYLDRHPEALIRGRSSQAGEK